MRGAGALSAAGAAWGLDYAVWFQQPDARVYWGEWADAFGGATPDPLPLDPALVLSYDPEARAVTIPALPNLRPGQPVQIAGEPPFLIQRVRIQGAQARLEYDPIAAGA